MKKSHTIRTLGDARDERSAHDAWEIEKERAAYIRQLKLHEKIARSRGWVEMADRYAARIAKSEGGTTWGASVLAVGAL